MSAACLLCTEARAGNFSEEQSSAADLTETITKNNFPKESEISDSTTESSISISDEFENDENSEDGICSQLEPVVKKLVSSEQEFYTRGGRITNRVNANNNHKEIWR